MRIGIVGTFDVENFGDLLFPLLAARELEQRLGPVEIHPYSYHARDAASWPYTVTPLQCLPDAIKSLDLLLVGGGDIIRFDSLVALDYHPESPDVHHPTGFWLAPILLAHTASVPVAWNAPGVPHDVPAWAHPLVRAAVAVSAYVSVRDAASRERLSRAAGGARVELVPDSGFNAAMLLPAPPAESDYVVVQSREGAEQWLPRIRHLLHSDRLRFVFAPVGPVTGDRTHPPASLPAGATFRVPGHPREMIELIAGSKGVAGPSLHLTIAALSLGRPAFRPPASALPKYRMLDGLKGVNDLDSDAPALAPEPSQLAELRRKLAGHWDTIAALARDAAAARRPRHDWEPLMMNLWQRLPEGLDRTPRLTKLRTALQTAKTRFARARSSD